MFAYCHSHIVIRTLILLAYQTCTLVFLFTLCLGSYSMSIQWVHNTQHQTLPISLQQQNFSPVFGGLFPYALYWNWPDTSGGTFPMFVVVFFCASTIEKGRLFQKISPSASQNFSKRLFPPRKPSRAVPCSSFNVNMLSSSAAYCRIHANFNFRHAQRLLSQCRNWLKML